MEYFLSAFLGGWMLIFGVIFMFAMNREYSHYFDDREEGKK
ncbi:hypothetical protein [Bacilliculturomica massiliensis]|nr:hypothetical protein [Bacilliculturomica massiliensis]